MWNNALPGVVKFDVSHQVKWNKSPRAAAHFTWRSHISHASAYFTNPQGFISLKKQSKGLLFLERVKGLEPSISAWKANVLPLHYTRMIFCFWCGRRDLNSYACAALEPKSSASANSATPAICAANAKMVTRRRFELRTPWLKVKCSTDWANGSYLAGVAGFEPAYTGIKIRGLSR